MSGLSAAIVLDASVILKWVLDAETEPAMPRPTAFWSVGNRAS